VKALTPLAILAAVVLFFSIYSVGQTEQVILTQFGKPVGAVVDTPGLHLKIPFVWTVHRFDKRWLEFDGDAREITTRDKKYIGVDIYARWRISKPLVYLTAVGDERSAQTRLDDIVDGETRNVVASYDLIELVRSSNRPFQLNEELAGIGAAEAQARITAGRSKLSAEVLRKASEIMPQYGIELRDVRFKRINYVESVQQKVFDRMISERRRIAERSRSEGQGRAAEIRGQKERDMLAASSVGYRTAQELKGAADAKSTSIYAKAYSRDAEFYQFLKSLETLAAASDDKTWLILSTDSELMRALKSSGAP
jgi:modulator of FtsH protease HflC